MANDRSFLARLLAGAPNRPLSFEELMQQERGNRDQAAMRFNAQNGGPASTAYGGAPDPMQTGGIPVPTPRPDLVATSAVPTPRPPPPSPVNPLQAAVDAAGPPPKPEQGTVVPGPSLAGTATPTPLAVPTPTPPTVPPESSMKAMAVPTPLNRGNIVEYGDARRGAVGKVKRTRGWLLKQNKINRKG